MSKESIARQANGGNANGTAAFTSLPNGQCAAGAVEQSYIERKWAGYQPWAAGERPDRNWGPCLTDEARQLLGANHVTDDHR